MATSYTLNFTEQDVIEAYALVVEHSEFSVMDDKAKYEEFKDCLDCTGDSNLLSGSWIKNTLTRLFEEKKLKIKAPSTKTSPEGAST